MRSGTLVVAFVMLVALSCAPAISLAAKCAGTNINNVVSWEPTEISKGTNLITLRLTSVTVSDDPAAFYHLVAGECVGSFRSTPDGKMQGSGTCARRDRNGDVLNEEWISTGGDGSRGTSKFVGGSGRFSNVSGTTEWEVIPLQGKTAAVRWTGDCK